MFTGNRLRHDSKMEITKETVADAKEAHYLLPSLIGLGVKCLLEKVVSSHLREYSPEMEVR